MKNHETVARMLAKELDGEESYWEEWEDISFLVLTGIGVDPHAEENA